MRGAFHVPPPFMLRSPPRYSGARRPVPRVLILDSLVMLRIERKWTRALAGYYRYMQYRSRYNTGILLYI